jgi:hypothetical protein
MYSPPTSVLVDPLEVRPVSAYTDPARVTALDRFVAHGLATESDADAE